MKRRVMVMAVVLNLVAVAASFAHPSRDFQREEYLRAMRYNRALRIEEKKIEVLKRLQNETNVSVLSFASNANHTKQSAKNEMNNTNNIARP